MPPQIINLFLTPTQSRDNPPNLLMFICFSFPDSSHADLLFTTFSAWPCLQILVVKRKFEIGFDIVFEMAGATL